MFGTRSWERLSLWVNESSFWDEGSVTCVLAGRCPVAHLFSQTTRAGLLTRHLANKRKVCDNEPASKRVWHVRPSIVVCLISNATLKCSFQNPTSFFHSKRTSEKMRNVKESIYRTDLLRILLKIASKHEWSRSIHFARSDEIFDKPKYLYSVHPFPFDFSRRFRGIRWIDRIPAAMHPLTTRLFSR